MRLPLIRALVAANILLSYLLNPASASPPARIGQGMIDQEFRALIAIETLLEVRRKVEEKPYLAARITRTELDAFLTDLPNVAGLLPELKGPIPAVGRDVEDDYLLAQADRANADVLVTGDEDLLVMRYYKGIWILSPAEFLVELRIWRSLQSALD